jgi:dihydrofolate synthase/folylpolyglutamate synthase
VRLWKGRAVQRRNSCRNAFAAGKAYANVAQAWHAAMADARPEDTVLVCGSFHTVAHVMEEIEAGRIGGE